MVILGIESSCDDTSIALVEAVETPPQPSPLESLGTGSTRGGSFRVLAEKTASQIDIHKKYGGVVPEVAARMHAEAIVPVIEEVISSYIKQSASSLASAIAETPPLPSPTRGGIYQTFKPDAIAVTSGPGLITSLIVGVEAAKTLSYLWDVPLVGVNHIEGHIHSVEIPNPKSQIPNPIEFPTLCLVVSGGHTELILMKDHGVYKRIGATRDDAAGECFDKVAKLLGLEYPGGPKISKLATKGNSSAIQFPRPMLREDNLDFSFAGLKTAALYWLRDHPVKESGIWNLEFGITLNDFCASFEQAVVDVLVTKTLRAAELYRPKSIILAGGVAANKKLRESLQQAIKQKIPDSRFQIPDSQYCMDNAAMIAVAGYYHALKKEYTNWKKIEVDPNWNL